MEEQKSKHSNQNRLSRQLFFSGDCLIRSNPNIVIDVSDVFKMFLLLCWGILREKKQMHTYCKY